MLRQAIGFGAFRSLDKKILFFGFFTGATDPTKGIHHDVLATD